MHKNKETGCGKLRVCLRAYALDGSHVKSAEQYYLLSAEATCILNSVVAHLSRLESPNVPPRGGDAMRERFLSAETLKLHFSVLIREVRVRFLSYNVLLFISSLFRRGESGAAVKNSYSYDYLRRDDHKVDLRCATWR